MQQEFPMSSSSNYKHESGAQKRKKKKVFEENLKKTHKDIVGFFQKKPENSSSKNFNFKQIYISFPD